MEAALDDPLEIHPLTRLADERGYGSIAHDSRNSRSRCGVSPGEWCGEPIDRGRRDPQISPDPVHTR